MGILLITHYERILKYIEPDNVLVISEGRIVREESDGQFKEIVRGTTINKDEVYILSLDDGLLLPYKFFQRKTIPPLREGGAPINFVGPEYLYFIKHRHKKKDDKKRE